MCDKTCVGPGRRKKGTTGRGRGLLPDAINSLLSHVAILSFCYAQARANFAQSPHSQCTAEPHSSLGQEWVYQAPPRYVPPPAVDPRLQMDFYQLFLSFPQNGTRSNLPLPFGISQADIDFMTSVCPKDAFFYSMSPQHVIARTMLQQYFESLPSAREVLRVARILLHKQIINQKVWYYALMGAVIQRPDMSGLQVPQPLDAIPDWFIPAPVLSEVLSKYKVVFGIGDDLLGGDIGGSVGRGVRSGGGGFGFSSRPASVSGLFSSHGPHGFSYQHVAQSSVVTEQRVKYKIDRNYDKAKPRNFSIGARPKSRSRFESRIGVSVSDPFKGVVQFSGETDTAAAPAEDDADIADPGDFGRRLVRYGGNKGTTTTRKPGNGNNVRRGKRRRVHGGTKGQSRFHGPFLPETEDHVPAASASISSPGSRVKFNLTGRANRTSRKMTTTTTSRSTSTSTTTPAAPQYIREVVVQSKLAYGEDDDEFDELKKELTMENVDNSTTRPILERILQRRQRRKLTKRQGDSGNKKGGAAGAGDEGKSRKVKRQVFGSDLFHHGDSLRDCVVINGTNGASNSLENKLWYWREDLMLNQHHWYWHQMYPVNATRHGDRRGEIFFFTHRNFVSRYNAERLSNGMPRTTELLLKHGSIVEDGYNSLLIDMNSRKYWTPREPHVPLTDILHEQDPDFARNIFLKDTEDMYYKLLFSIKDRHLLGPDHQAVPIANFPGIDNLANTVEASELSVNPIYYDSRGVHNLGHEALGLSSDPQFVLGTPPGVMGDTAVTMYEARDPVFYTFHSGIDNLFDKYKRTLPPYELYGGDFPLVWQGVAISSVLILPSLHDGHNNKIRTFWTKERFPLESGIDYSIHNGQIKEDVCALHLDHEPFTYQIKINVNPCVHSVSGQGTVRIFMAPRYDEYGERFPLKVQRRLMFQLDAFPVKLRAGVNVILRRSQDSSLTKPWPMSMREQILQADSNRGAADFCGCGFPRHLLIPKGTPQGMLFDVFVMITNYDEDVVHDSIEDLRVPESCTSPYLMCGVPWRRYPDARPMGYPFDRLPYKIPVGCRSVSGLPDILCKAIQPEWFKTPETLEEYVTPVPNMAATVVNVQHFDTLVT